MAVKQSTLSAERVHELLDYDPATGLFTWRVRPSIRSHVQVGAVAGYVTVHGYRVIGIDNRNYLAHRLVWLHVHGRWPSGEIDHLSGVTDDNRIANLRDVTSALNQQNQRRAQARNSSGFLGVTWNKSRRAWRACISLNKRNLHLGYFNTPEEAHQTYLEAKRLLHPGCTI